MTSTILDLLTERVPLSTGAMAKFNYSKELEKKYTCVSRFDEVYTTFRTDYKHIWVPRAVAPIGEKDFRVRGFKCGMVSKVVPRNEKQVRMITQGRELLDADESFILQAATGTGKTVVCLDLICHVNRPALVIVPKDDLMQQWYDQALKFTNIPAKRIGFIQGDTCIYENKWLVIAMLHSIAKDSRYPPAMYKYFGQIFWDEAHRISAETFAESGTVFPALIRVGATATPQRSDGKETILEATIGPVKIIENGDPLKFKVLKWRSNWECPKVQVRDDDGTVRYVKIPHSAGKCGHVQNMLAKYKPDQEKVSEWAHKCYKKGRHTVIFSDRIEHLQALMQQCKQKGVPANEMSLYVGSYEKDGKKVSMSRDQKEKAKGKRLLFASYGAMKEGTDIPWVDTIIFAMPRSDVAQALGRMLREYEGKQKPTAFDIAHDDSPVFKAYGRARDKYYESKKADVRWL